VNRKNRKGENYVTRYTRFYLRPLFYEITNKENLDIYPEEIRLAINYQKLKPEIKVNGNRVIWKCKGKPTIIIDFGSGNIYSDSMEGKMARIKSNNQASHIIFASKKIGRMQAHYGKRRKRRKKFGKCCPKQ